MPLGRIGLPVGPLGWVARMVVGSRGVRALIQSEDRKPRIGGIERLVGQHRHVLGDVVSERHAEDADIVGSPVAGPDHGLRIQLVGESQARRQVGQVRFDVAIQADAVFAGDQDLARGQVLEASVVLAVHVLREVNLPAQAVIQGQLRGDAPGVLNVGEEPLLAFGGIGRVTHVARRTIPHRPAGTKPGRGRRHWDLRWWSR